LRKYRGTLAAKKRKKRRLLMNNTRKLRRSPKIKLVFVIRMSWMITKKCINASKGRMEKCPIRTSLI
jgi:hypothetical protein